MQSVSYTLQYICVASSGSEYYYNFFYYWQQWEVGGADTTTSILLRLLLAAVGGWGPGREHFQLKSSVKERPGRPSGVNGGRRGYIIHNSNHDHLLEISFMTKTWMEEETDRK